MSCSGPVANQEPFRSFFDGVNRAQAATLAARNTTPPSYVPRCWNEIRPGRYPGPTSRPEPLRDAPESTRPMPALPGWELLTKKYPSRPVRELERDLGRGWRGGPHPTAACLPGLARTAYYDPVTGGSHSYDAGHGSTSSSDAGTAQPCRDSPDFGTSSYRLVNNQFYVDEEFGEESSDAIRLAMTQLAANTRIVEDYFDLAGVSGQGACVIHHILGTARNGVGATIRLHLKLDRGLCSYGYTAFDVIHLNPDYVKAVANSLDRCTWGEGDGECSCLVTDLSRTILHETAHICERGERLARLLDSFYAEQLERRNNFGHRNCCGRLHTLPSFDPSDYSDASAVGAQMSTHGFSKSSGEWRLSRCVGLP